MSLFNLLHKALDVTESLSSKALDAATGLSHKTVEFAKHQYDTLSPEIQKHLKDLNIKSPEDLMSYVKSFPTDAMEKFGVSKEIVEEYTKKFQDFIPQVEVKFGARNPSELKNEDAKK